MPDIYPPPNSIAPADSQTSDQIPVQDKDLAAYKYAKALCETARSVAMTRTQSFKANWDFMLGRGHWGRPASKAAQVVDSWAFQGVVNWTFATIKTKSAMICGAPAEVSCDPLDEESTYYDRLLVKSVIEDDLARLNFKDVKRDAYLSGSATGIGVSMLSTKPDPLTGAMVTVLTPINSGEFFRDPSADSTRSPNCRFVTWEPELDMSTIREMWPSKAPYVKADIRPVTGGFTYRPDSTDDNLVYGTAGEFVVDQHNILHSRKARVSFVWIRDESIIEDLHEVLIKEATMGVQCTDCGAMFDESYDDCLNCGAATEPAEIPAKYQQNRVIRRKYPYGRLIVYSGQTLLFDGENPHEIETVFPFALYQHERIPGDFYGTNDVDILQSLQEAQNITVCQLIDYVRLAVNSPILYPSSYKAITDLGNGPNQKLPGPDRLPWQPFRLSIQGFDTQSWQTLHSAIFQHFEVVSGLAKSLSGPSSPPISATEAEIANNRLSDRMKAHAQEFSTYCSEVASLDYQLRRQIAAEEAKLAQERGEPSPVNTLMVTMPDSTVKAIDIEVHKLPRVNVRVAIDSDISVKDKLQGQNSLPIFTDPNILQSPFLGTILGGIGYSPAQIKEVEMKRGLQSELVPPGVGGPPPQAGPQPQPEGGM